MDWESVHQHDSWRGDKGMRDTPKKVTLKGSKTVPTKDHTYQPSKAEKEGAVDMPGWRIGPLEKSGISTLMG